jgi:lactoylglutathione lyase
MRLGYVIRYVDDVEAAIAFHERAFGLKRGFVAGTDYGELQTGEVTLAFAKAGEAPGPGAKGETEVAFVTDDVAAGFAAAREAGAQTVAEPKYFEHGQTVGWVRDPEGDLIEICTPVGS